MASAFSVYRQNTVITDLVLSGVNSDVLSKLGGSAVRSTSTSWLWLKQPTMTLEVANMDFSTLGYPTVKKMITGRRLKQPPAF